MLQQIKHKLITIYLIRNLLQMAMRIMAIWWRVIVCETKQMPRQHSKGLIAQQLKRRGKIFSSLFPQRHHDAR